MSAELEHIWSRVQTELAAAVDEPTYRIWLEPLTARDLSHGRLSVEVHAQACGWVRDRFGRVLQSCAASVIGPEVVVELLAISGAVEESGQCLDGRRAPGQDSERGPDGGPDPAGAPRGPSESRAGALANPKLTFDQFVIGDCNRLAHAAALTVAEMPASCLQPPVHLRPSRGRQDPPAGLDREPAARPQSGSGGALHDRRGVHQRVPAGALRAAEPRRSRAVIATIDVLLVDDVQFLERKTRTEEEFFHTFNALYDGGRQIVLSSDRPPRDLQALEDRLRERFESGLVADIQPPDPATRMTILRKRAQHDHLKLDDESPLELIAERVTENVRAIEGALIRVVAFGSLTARPLSVELTREVLDGLYPTTQPPDRRRAVSIEEIKTAACEHFGITPSELVSASRTVRVAWPRQVAMYLARELTGQSLPAIGRQFGERDHTTVMHACRRTATRIADDSSSRKAVDTLIEDLHNGRHDTSMSQPDRYG